jgi:GTP-binding protein HflX
VLVFNKLDAMDPASLPRELSDVMELDGTSVSRTFVSAHTGQGIPGLRALLAQRVLATHPNQDPDLSGALAESENPLP